MNGQNPMMDCFFDSKPEDVEELIEEFEVVYELFKKRKEREKKQNK